MLVFVSENLHPFVFFHVHSFHKPFLIRMMFIRRQICSFNSPLTKRFKVKLALSRLKRENGFRKLFPFCETVDLSESALYYIN